MADNERKYWFSSKYGFGWYPSSFKGVIVYVVYFAFLIYVFLRINEYSNSTSSTLMNFAPFIFGATIVLLFICYLTGEPIKVKRLKI